MKTQISSKLVYRVILATNQSLALEIRDVLFHKIQALMPNAFDSEMWDTNPEGKGFKPGYVSFALRPTAFDKQGLLGGILISGTYSTDDLISDSPEYGTPEYKEWLEQGGNIKLDSTGKGTDIAIELEAGYYSKKGGHGRRELGSFTNAGEAVFSIDNKEQIKEFELDSDSETGAAIESIINDILNNPPPEAIAAPRKPKRRDPARNKKAFLQFLRDEGRNTITRAELRQISKNTDTAQTTLEEWFRGFGVSVAG